MGGKNSKILEPDLYQNIVSDYRQTGSVKRTSENFGVSEVTARRVLITEGLWSSKTSRKVEELRSKGMYVDEIASMLSISEKAVQAYLPYSRGMYGVTQSDNAEYSKNYRERIIQAQKGVNTLTSVSDNAEIQDVSTSDIIYNENEWGDEMLNLEKEKGNMNGSISKKQTSGHARGNGIIYKLHLQLTGQYWDDCDKNLGLSKQERDLLFKLGKAEKGFSRDILVPGNMTLHALNYAIQKLFGWQNSHLHNFALNKEDFNKVTDNGLLGEYEDLCGILFRFVADIDDACWDDDYEEGISIKSWFRKKYSAPFLNGSVGDSYLANLWDVGEFNARFPDNEYDTTLEEVGNKIIWDQDPNYLIERLTVSELLLPKSARRPKLSTWRDSIKSKGVILEEFLDENNVNLDTMQEAANELMVWRQSNDNLDSLKWQYPDTYKEEVEERTGHPYDEVEYTNRQEVKYWENKCKKIINDWNITMEPYFRELYYLYDYGDGWTVKITVDDTFYKYEGDSGETIYFDSEGWRIDDELNEKVSAVDFKGRPICIAADGMNLVDDCGGIYGYLDMLKTIHGTRRKDADEMLTWARSLGWTGKMTKPEKML